MKRIAAIMIASLFVLTAFAVLEMPQNATVNHIPVPFPYAQISPAKPYVATSNGLTYTVEPNGTYLWNGHYLRAPPVPYPKVPTIAPDGLPYGAVGPVGAQGHIGPYSFTRGTPKIVGTTPNSTKPTWVNTSTIWENETITLGGNVTITNVPLKIIDSTITFAEPSSGNNEYGFNWTQEFNRNGGILSITNGSVIEQTGSLAWFARLYSYAVVQNSTLLWSSDTVSSAVYSLLEMENGASGHSIFFPVLDLNYSLISGPSTVFSAAYFGSANTGNQQWHYDEFRNMDVAAMYDDTIGSSFTNLVFNNSYNDGVPYNTQTKIDGNYPVMYDTWIDINSSLTVSGSQWKFGGTLVSFLYLMYGSGSNTTIYRDLFGEGNYSGADIIFGANLSVVNTTVTGIRTSGSLSTLFAIQTPGTTGRLVHSTFSNITVGAEMQLIFLSPYDPTSPSQVTKNVTVEYNLFSDMKALKNVEWGFAQWMGVNDSVIGNKFQNFTGQYIKPLSQNGPYTSSDQSSHGGSAIYANVGNWYSNGPPPRVEYNWVINESGPTNVFSQFGQRTDFSENVGINFTNGAFLEGLAFNTGSAFNNINNNSVYGIYNWSAGIESLGGDYRSTISNNHFYDVSVSSQGVTSWNVVSIYNHQDGYYMLNNGNGTYGLYGTKLPSPYSASPGYYFANHTTQIFIDNSNVSSVYIIAVKSGVGVDSANITRNVLPNDFNITIYNSYVPAVWNSINESTLNPFSFSNGPYTLSAPYSNPSFLNLTGFLGIYQGQTYTINASNIKGESSLPVYLAGSQIASIPASSAHYNLTASYSSGTLEYSLSANSASDQPISIMWNGQVPNTEYSVAMYDHGKLIDYSNVTSSANGVVTFTYNPATMPLDPTFELTTISASMPPPTPVSNTFLYLEIGLIAVLSVGLVIPLIIRRQYR